MYQFEHFFVNYIAVLPFRALIKVASSAYSISVPTEIPCAILVTLILNGLINLDKYMAVASPSTDE